MELNQSPASAYDGWMDDRAALCTEIAAVLSPVARTRLAAEAIMFPTLNAQPHVVNLGWHPQAEELL